MDSPSLKATLRDLPSVDELLAALKPRLDDLGWPRPMVRDAVRAHLADLRERLGRGEVCELAHLRDARAVEQVLAPRLEARLRGRYLRVVNGTGILLHTGLGRALLSERAVQALARSARYGLLEIDRETATRCRREQPVVDLLCELLACPGALVVNNNAGAVLLALSCLATGKEVVVSRGELVEIGGGFRVPEIMQRGGARLREVGTTNRTTIADYERALGPEVGLILRVHPSNFRVVGFTGGVTRAELAGLARRAHLPLVEDLGSGLLRSYPGVDTFDEPTAADALRAGVDLVTFSGDKLLGGPQAGIVVGRADLVSRLRADPFFRALRPDKLQLVALEATLIDHLAAGDAPPDTPLYRMLRATPEELETRAHTLARHLAERVPQVAVRTIPSKAQLGSGSVPGYDLPSFALALEVPGMSADRLTVALRQSDPPIFARIHEGELLLDVRTLLAGDEAVIAESLARLARA
jgi:L-seryl-tRNA(Ser) seleniumtransferase